MHRRGSFLLICLAIVATATIIAFGLLRAATTSRNAGLDGSFKMLARGAALTGATHAMHQIVLGHTSEPFTRLAGPARAPFRAHVGPYISDTSTTDSSPTQVARTGWDDIPLSDIPTGIIWSFYMTGAPVFGGRDFSDGMSNWTGRARYWEPAIGWRVPAGSTLPTTIQRFGDPLAPNPDWNEGSTYTQDLRPATSADTARYRTRYAVGMWDLDSSVLVTGDGDMDYRTLVSTNAADHADPDAKRILRHQYAMRQIAAWTVNPALAGSNRTTGAKIQHLYLNRGCISNHDLRPTTATGFAPVTFSAMYRFSSRERSDKHYIHHGLFSNVWTPASGSPATGVGYTTAVPHTSYHLLSTVTSLGTSIIPAVNGTLAGGEVLPHYANQGVGAISGTGGQTEYYKSFRRSLLGPQFSFNCMQFAIAPNMQDQRPGTYTDMQDGDVGYSRRHPGTLVLTPFGRGLRTASGATGHWSGPAETPWHVNVLTAPPTSLRAHILAYFPQDVLRDIWKHRSNPAYDRFMPLWQQKTLQCRQMLPAFELYEAPRRLSPAIDPDLDLPSRKPASTGWVPPGTSSWGGSAPTTVGWGWKDKHERYPGKICFNGYDAAGVLCNDDLGRRINVSDRDWPKDYLCGGPWSTGSWAHQCGTVDNGVETQQLDEVRIPGAWLDPAVPDTMPQTGAVYNYTRSPGQNTSLPFYPLSAHPDSYWRDLHQALCTAIAIAQAQHIDVSTRHFNPATCFNGGAWVGAKVQSLADLDRLFLLCLGIDIDHPTAAPVANAAWGGDRWWPRYARYTVSNNLFTLRTASADFATDAAASGFTANERTQVMELMLNDMRMSFFGASPHYPAFLPLDFDGDGRTMCSAYAENPAATAHEHDLGISEYVTTATAPAQPFSVTGAFFIGRSRFWRILVRGEVWDNVLMRKVTEALHESVVAVDPIDETNDTGSAPSRPGRQYSTHTIFQRWIWDFNDGSYVREAQ